MDLAKLTEQFLIDEDAAPERLSDLIQKLLPFCVVRKNGTVEINRSDLSGKDIVKVVLSARLVASKLGDSAINSDVTAEEIAAYTGLPKNQAAARAKEAVDERFAERSARGSYRARLYKVDDFLRNLTSAQSKEK
jgi:hypothetical protein